MVAVTHLALSSAGRKLFLLVGGLDALQARNRELLKSISGVSAGALVGLLCVLKIHTDKFMEYMETELSKEGIGILDPCLIGVISNNGLVKGDRLFTKLGDFISRETSLDRNFTFSDLHRYNPDTVLSVAAYNVSLQKQSYFTHNSAPGLSVLEAVRMSCAIPFVFQSRMYGDHVYVDGAVHEHLPLGYFDEESIVVAFDVISSRTSDASGTACDSSDKPIRGFVRFATTILEAFYQQHQVASSETCERLVKLRSDQTIRNDPYIVPSIERMHKDYESGKRQVEEWIRDCHPKS